MIATVELDEGLAALTARGIVLPGNAGERLAAYLALLAKWNRTHNLTAIRDPERMVTHHVLDALVVLPHLPARAGMRLLDVGSGGGVPGLPLAIARPEWQVVVLDSNHKKGAFLQQAIIELGLANAQAVTSRVEDYVPAAPFDVVVSRAFAELAEFVEQAKHLVAPGGAMLAMKGVHPFEEIAKVPPTHRVENVIALRVPTLDAQRHLVLLKAA